MPKFYIAVQENEREAAEVALTCCDLCYEGEFDEVTRILSLCDKPFLHWVKDYVLNMPRRLDLNYQTIILERIMFVLSQK